jgi:hypothetical protein
LIRLQYPYSGTREEKKQANSRQYDFSRVIADAISSGDLEVEAIAVQDFEVQKRHVIPLVPGGRHTKRGEAGYYIGEKKPVERTIRNLRPGPVAALLGRIREKPSELVAAWIESKGAVCPFASAQGVSADAPPKTGENLYRGKRPRKGEINERRVQIILAKIDEKGWDARCIPRGGKGEIGDLCLKQTDLFSKSTFDLAWGVAVKDGLVRTERHDTYIKGRRAK